MVESNTDYTQLDIFDDQYSLGQILAIWLVASLPIGLLGWFFGPWLAPRLSVDESLQQAIARLIALTIGLIWLFVLSMIIVKREMGDLSWLSVRQRLVLQTPIDPRTGEQSNKAWIWFVPFFGVLLIYGNYLHLGVGQVLGLEAPEDMDPGTALGDPEVQQLLVGAWWFFFLMLTMAVFNVVLGEEFLFRGILLPKMRGVFGKYDWIANAVLFGTYHLHQPWDIPSAIVQGLILLSISAKLFKSTWYAIALHSIASILLMFMVLGIVLGLA